MYVHKGKETFSAVNISGSEMALIFDSLNNYQTQLLHLLKLPDEEFLKAHGTESQRKGKKIREMYEIRIKSGLPEIINNITPHVSQG